ncbi:MAG: transcription termination factor NusA [Deltaproteobacteria bacterium]|jgi:N utilization substance protein A|nr:transcription termination factor NusA [Deltaproteobacteria bacterium]
MSTELKKAIDQISKDKGLDRSMLIATLEAAVEASVQRKYGEGLDIEVSFDEESGDINVFQFKIVVEDPADEDTQISLAEAQKNDPSVQLDDEVGLRLRVEDLGRIAAQSAKQVIIQRMRKAEQEIIYKEYKDRKNEIVSGSILRRDKAGWIVNLGRTEALLPKEEQIPREHYKRGERLQALIVDVRGPSGDGAGAEKGGEAMRQPREWHGPQIIISRAHRDYMAALFKREVPEVDDGTVQIMGVARNPGSRAKVAVMSRDRDVDPVGACVGVRGSRIQNIVQELRGERIDIVVWHHDIATYAGNALAPAVISRIIIDEDENKLEVIVPDDQLINAIGRRGQNVTLAAKLLSWKITVYTESRYNEANLIGQWMENMATVAGVPLENFLDAGFRNLDDILRATDEELGAVQGVNATSVADIRYAANFVLQSSESRKEEGGAPRPEEEAQ